MAKKTAASFLVVPLLCISNDNNKITLYSGRKRIGSFDDIYTGLDAEQDAYYKARRQAIKAYNAQSKLPWEDGYTDRII